MDQQLVQLLESVLAPDTERVKNATTKLRKEVFSSPAALVPLIQVVTSTEVSPGVRQLAAVEARSLVPKYWNKLGTDQQLPIRNALLQAIMQEPVALVRHSAARIIAAIATIDLTDGDWADLPTFLQQAATSQIATQRETGVYILYTLLDVMASDFVDRFGVLFKLFQQTIQDPESTDVRVNTLLALSKMAMVLDADEDPESLTAFRDIFPRMVEVLEAVVRQGDEDRTTQAFEVFQTLLGCEPQLMARDFEPLVMFMVNLSSSKDIDNDSRSQALSFLMQCVKYRKLKVQGMRLGELMTLKALEIVPEVGDLHGGDDDITPGRSALALLDIMAQSLPPSQVVVPLLNALPNYVNSPDPQMRRAGIMALGYCVEGAPDFFSTQLKEIFPMVMRLLNDPEIRVREAALYGLARLADDLAEDLAKRHEELIPVLIDVFNVTVEQAIKSPDDEQQLNILKATCGAIDLIFSGMDEAVGAMYVSGLVPQLGGLLQHSDLKVKAAAISAMGSVAAASGASFIPYFQTIITVLSPYVMIKDSEDELLLRGVVCDALGSIATAVGPQTFQPYVEPLMRSTEEALHLDHMRLKETSFILWSTLAKIYHEDFAPFLGGIAKSLIESVKQEEPEFEVELGEEARELLGTEIVIAGKKVKVAAAESDGKSVLRAEKRIVAADEDDDADDDVVDLDDADEDDEAWDELTGATAVAMEKEIALDVIADVVSHTGKEYLPYYETTIESILELVDHSYEGVRKSAIGALWRAYATLWGIQEEAGSMGKWQPGLPLKVQPTPELAKLAETGITATVKVWKEEPERAVVTDINSSVAAVLKDCGPAILINQDIVKQITGIVLDILEKRHPCQQDLGEEDDTKLIEESSEYDWMTIDAALDVVAGLATALGPVFGELWKVFEKPVWKYAVSSDAAKRAAGVGTMATCIGGMGGAVGPFTPKLMKLLVHRLTDEDPHTRSNAAFATGLLCEKSDNVDELHRSFNTILSKLEPMFDQKDAAAVQDNAAGCVSRMILRFPDQVPLDDVLPAIIKILPLKQDYDENEPVWQLIVRLYQQENPLIRQFTPALMPALSSVLGEPRDQLTDERRGEVIQLVKYLHQQQPALLGQDKILHEVVSS
ncbi:MAG: hypothetical protein M1823_002598 [Watsoniomyces obsoletus]|nr:MAG: hypothetical protein M1823_002598 [Watsoniomyces obsoletus]